jgi:hypothetical protein
MLPALWAIFHSIANKPDEPITIGHTYTLVSGWLACTVHYPVQQGSLRAQRGALVEVCGATRAARALFLPIFEHFTSLQLMVLHGCRACGCTIRPQATAQRISWKLTLTKPS